MESCRRLLIRDGSRISGLMIFDLEANKFVNGCDGVGILTHNANSRSVGEIFHLVANFPAQPLHGGPTRRHTGVDQHGRIEISLAEHGGDVLQVLSNFRAAR